jgi:DinB superfamily
VSLSRGDLLRWQFDLTWSLLKLHLEQLTPDDFLWEPMAHCWTVHRGVDGEWVPDWQEPEPEPAPIPTIAWVTWHIGWWWTVTMDHAQGRSPRDRSEVGWPGEGTATIEWLRNLRMDWLAVLDRLTDVDLDVTAPFPWQSESGRTVAHMVGWVNAELMKNTAEIGQLRLLRAASAGKHDRVAGSRSSRSASSDLSEPGTDAEQAQ